MSKITWNDLTATERDCLNTISKNPLATVSSHPFESLEQKGLVVFRWNVGNFLTDLGRAVLAQAPVADNAPANKPETITATQWDTVAEAWQQGKAVIRDCFGDITAKIEQLPNGDYEATDIYGESWFVKPVSAKYGTFTVEWFTLPNPLPDPEDIADNERGEELVELFKRVEVRLEYLNKSAIELGLPIAEETTLEQWLNNAADYLPIWYNDAIKDNAQLSLNQQPAAEPAKAAGEGELVRYSDDFGYIMNNETIDYIILQTPTDGHSSWVAIHPSIQQAINEGWVEVIYSAKYVNDQGKGYTVKLTEKGRGRRRAFMAMTQLTEIDTLQAELTTMKAERDAALNRKTWPYSDYQFDYIPYALKITDGDNEHPTNYGVVKVTHKAHGATDTFVEYKEVERLEAALAAARLREARLREALKPFAEAGKTIKQVPPPEVELEPDSQLVLDENIVKVYGISDTVTIGHFMQAALAAGSEGASDGSK